MEDAAGLPFHVQDALGHLYQCTERITPTGIMQFIHAERPVRLLIRLYRNELAWAINRKFQYMSISECVRTVEEEARVNDNLEFARALYEVLVLYENTIFEIIFTKPPSHLSDIVRLEKKIAEFWVKMHLAPLSQSPALNPSYTVHPIPLRVKAILGI